MILKVDHSIEGELIIWPSLYAIYCHSQDFGIFISVSRRKIYLLFWHSVETEARTSDIRIPE